jgi:NAD(P)H-dependent FMN reductase
MTATIRIAVLVGSLRADSVHRRLAELLRDEAPGRLHLDILEGLDQVPFYNEDLDGADTPAVARSLRERVAQADSVLAVTPEYNGTIPAVLKNAIDWLSRPYGVGALTGKPFAVVGTSSSRFGGKWAHEDALRSAQVAGATVVEEATVSHPASDGDLLTDADARARLHGAIAKLVDFVPLPAA